MTEARNVVERLRILLVEDDPMDAERIRSALGQAQETRFQVDHVTHLNLAVKKLVQSSYAACIADMGLPDSTSPIDTVVELVKAAGITPILVLSGYSDISMAEKAIECGAKGFVRKNGLDPESLEFKLRTMVFQSAAELEQRELLLESKDILVASDATTVPPPQSTVDIRASMAAITKAVTEARRAVAQISPAAAESMDDALKHHKYGAGVREVYYRIGMEAGHTPPSLPVEIVAKQVIRRKTSHPKLRAVLDDSNPHAVLRDAMQQLAGQTVGEG